MCGSNHAVAFLSSDCEAIIGQLQLRSYNISNNNTQHQTTIYKKIEFWPVSSLHSIIIVFNSYDDGTKCIAKTQCR